MKNRHLSTVTIRRLFVTTKGYIGVMPYWAQEGDEIWLAPGSSVPLVLRKAASGTGFVFVSTAYVHGVMYGEYWSEPRSEARPVIIQ